MEVQFIENFKMALDSIKSNKLRSFLTMLGIIIGISSVITILSLGNGGKQSITGELEKIGSSTAQIKVNPQNATKADFFNLNDVKTIREKSNSVKYVSPLLQRQGIVKDNVRYKKSVIYGANPDYNFIQNNEFLYGRYFSDKELEDSKYVAVIDEATADYFFGYKDATGETLLIGKNTSPKKVTIVGVVKSPQIIGGMGGNQVPAFISMPITAVDSMFDGDGTFDNIFILAENKDIVDEATNEAINIIESRHNNKDQDLYSGEKLMKQVQQINKVIDIFTSFISAVAAISLLVGGIGVMNIMLVSVTERTREIGIRKAIGATTNMILIQFLTESIIISLIGGIIGLLLGIAGAYGLGKFAGVIPVLSIKHIILVILFSSSVGIFFGIYPARKAAKLDPINALRYE